MWPVIILDLLLAGLNVPFFPNLLNVFATGFCLLAAGVLVILWLVNH